MSDGTLIVPRRNFLIRALGFTAMGASVPVPVLALDTPESRLEHHVEAVKTELRAIYPGYDVGCMRNILMHDHVKAIAEGRPYYGDGGIPLSFTIQHRESAARRAEYERERRALAERYGM